MDQATPADLLSRRVSSQMTEKTFLGEFEQMVLLAILQASDEAYALAVIKELDRRAGRLVDRGALYKTLDRMETKGLVKWKTEPSIPGRGGHRRRLFHVLRPLSWIAPASTVAMAD